MTPHARLLGIVVALSWLGLSAASAAGGTSKDAWKGTWKFEIDRQDQPWLGFYDTEGVVGGVPFRWAKQHALAVVSTPDPWLQLSVWVDHPDLAANPVDASVWRDGKRVMQIHLTTAAHEELRDWGHPPPMNPGSLQ